MLKYKPYLYFNIITELTMQYNFACLMKKISLISWFEKFNLKLNTKY